MNLKRKSISVLLCISMLLSILMPITPVAYTGVRNIEIQRDGSAIQELDLYQDEKVLLSVNAEEFDAESYQWQLLYDTATDPFWISIYDRTGETCEVTYALVKNLLNASGETYIRCCVRSEEREVFSESVHITVLEKEITSGFSEIEKVLLTDRIVLESDSDALATDSNSVLATGSNCALATDSDSASNSNADRVTNKGSSTKKLPSLFSMRDAKEYHTVTIKYLDISSVSSGKESAIYSPYVATIERGSDFEQTVISPTFLGFAPFYDQDGIDQGEDGDLIDDDASELALDIESIDEDIVYEIYYKPIDVDFAVRYFFQNINDDLYTERIDLYHKDKAKTGTIIDEEYIRQYAGDTTGFEKMYHIPQSVAADGSTVFECYYDRNYYLIQFDMNGGYGVEPVYARYGTPFVVNDPVRHGYIFKGWDLLISGKGDGIIDELPSTILENSLSYKAIWETVDTTYTVVYWKENADDNGYSYWGFEKRGAVSSTYMDAGDTAAADGMPDAQYFTFNKEKSDKGILIEGDGTSVVNAYYTRNYYKLTFKATGKCTIVVNHTHGDECYDQICGRAEHDHTDTCGKTLACGLSEHLAHDESCIACGTVEHAHGEAGCDCKITEHEHSTACWKNVGNASTPNNAPKNPKDGQIYIRKYGWQSYYIYIRGTWYTYSKNDVNDGDIITPTCGKTEHSHEDADCECKKMEHSHVNSCYKDIIHSHVELCFRYTCGFTAHTHNEACKRLRCAIAEKHTHSGNCNSATKTNTVKTVYRKYQQSMEDLWPVVDDNGISYVDGERWSPSDSSYYNQVLVYISLMPPDDFILTLNDSNYSIKTMNYYLQVLPGESYDKVYNSKQYKLKNTIKAKYNYITKAEDFFDIKGFSQEVSNPNFSGSQINASNVDFYYSRNDYTLQFNNNGTVESEVDHVLYEAPLKTYNITPNYPSNLEPNAYEFAGWYTSPGCFAGTEVDWNSMTMPDGDLLLYAKWTPKMHEVRFFKTYDDMLAFEGGDTSIAIHEDFPEVPHGTVVGTVSNPTLTNGSSGGLDLIFAGWFYIENGKKMAFSPLDMPINKDMDIFADWSSKQPQPYRIEYVLKNDPKVPVADSTEGFAYGGSTRTFTAKAGNPYNQLYEAYNKGYYPTVGSHSITMQYEEDKNNPQINVYTFYYVEANNIKYTVRYVNKENNTLLEPETVKTTTDAVVTERFKAFANMVPDAFYKRLVISVKWDAAKETFVGTEENIITFYYTPNQESAYYAVHYMLEKPNATGTAKNNYAIDGSGGYEETGTHVEGIGDVGSSIEIIPQEFAGFTLAADKAKVAVGESENNCSYNSGKYKITVTKEGTELYIFYNRMNYDYNVYYYIYNTTESVSSEYPPKNGTAPYGSTVTAVAPEIPGYSCVSALTTQSMNIRDNVAQNVIIFYYSPLQYVTEYLAVPSDGGWLSTTIEVKTGSQDFSGSIPHANDYYEFAGWYLDEACTISVAGYGSVEEETGKFVPHKEKLSDTNRNLFYAKFIRKAGNLTISRANTDDDSQVFVYEVKNPSTNESIMVTVTGNGSVTIHDLPFGEYVVTQQGDWSWRYTDPSQTCNHNNSEGTQVSFGQSVQNPYWLNGFSALIKNRKKEE